MDLFCSRCRQRIEESQLPIPEGDELPDPTELLCPKCSPLEPKPNRVLESASAFAREIAIVGFLVAVVAGLLYWSQ